MRTFSPKPADIPRAWYEVDADGAVLGRLATEVAAILRGKHKPIFAPHVDGGDHVVVINADKVVITSGKAETKISYRHSGYPGGLTATTYSDLMIDRADQLSATPSTACSRRAGWAARWPPSSRSTGGPSIRTPPSPPSRWTCPSPAAPPRPGVARKRPRRPGTEEKRTEEHTVATAAPICQSTGRRKAAVARVRLRPGQGAITVNKRPIDDYFPSATHRMIITEPLRLIEKTEVYDIDTTMDGGGVSGQAGALRLGIARALCELDPELRAAAQAGRLPDPRRPGEGVEEVRPEEGPQGTPVLQALTARWLTPGSAPTGSGGSPTRS